MWITNACAAIVKRNSFLMNAIKVIAIKILFNQKCKHLAWFCFRFCNNLSILFEQRKCAERVEKLKSIQSKISISQAKKDPVRQAKLAYVAGPPKPSAQIRRKQIRYGTGEEATRPGDKQKPVRKELDNKHKNEAEHTIPFIKIPRRERCSTEPPKRVHRPDILSKKPGREIIL